MKIKYSFLLLIITVFTNSQLFSQTITIKNLKSPLCNGQKTYIQFDTTGLFIGEDFILYRLDFQGFKVEMARSKSDSIAISPTFSTEIFIASSISKVSSAKVSMSVDAFTGLFLKYSSEAICNGYTNPIEIYTGLASGDEIFWTKNNAEIDGAKQNIYQANETGTYKAKVKRGACIYSVGGTANVEIGSIRKAVLSSKQPPEVCEGFSVPLDASIPVIADLSYQWLYNGEEISTANMRTYLATKSGSYQLRLSQGECTSLSDKFAVKTGNLKPGKIITQPIVSTNSAVTICEGTSAGLSISDYQSASNMSITWLKDGVKLAKQNSDQNIYVKEAGIYRYLLKQGSCEVLSEPLILKTAKGMRGFDLKGLSGTSSCAGKTVELIINSKNNVISQSAYSFKLYKGGQFLSDVPFLFDYLKIKETGKYHVEGRYGSDNCTVYSDTLNVTISNSSVPFQIYAGIDEIQSCSDSTLIAQNLNLTGLDSPSVQFLWKKDGQSISNGNQKALYAKSSGTYSLSVALDSSCVYESTPLKVSLKSFNGKIQKPEKALCAANLNELLVQIGDKNIRTQKIGGDLLLSNDVSYQWFLDNAALGTKSSQTISKSGKYSVDIFHKTCTVNTPQSSVQLLELNRKLTPSIDTLSICPAGGLVVISAIGIADSYQWINDSINATSTEFEIYADKLGSYKVWMEKEGCSGFSETKVVKRTNASPTATLSGGETIEIGKKTDLKVALTGSAPWNLTTSSGETFLLVKSPFTWKVSPTENTSYSLTTVTNPCGSGETFGGADVNVLVLGNEESKTDGLSVYPNPGVDKIRLELRETPSSKTDYKIYNLNGEILKSSLVSEKVSDIDISNLSEGSYIIRVVSGQSVRTRKIIKRSY